MEYLNSKKYKYFPETVEQKKKKKKKPEKTLGNLPNFLWAHSPSTWWAHRETQLASWWLSNSLSLGMTWRDNGFPNLWPWDDQTVSELELLLCPEIQKLQGLSSDPEDQLPNSSIKWSTLHHLLLLFRKIFLAFSKFGMLNFETCRKHCVFWKSAILQSCRIVKRCYSQNKCLFKTKQKPLN